MKIKLSKNWKHKSFVQIDFEHISTPIKQIIDLMPEEDIRTDDEKSLFMALTIIKWFIEKYSEVEVIK